MSTVTNASATSAPDPNITSVDPGLPALRRLFWPWSAERRILDRCRAMLDDYDPQPPAYCRWHGARMAKTFALLQRALGSRGTWLDVSSDAWFCLLARHYFPDWQIQPTSFINERFEFRSKSGAPPYTFAPSELRIDADTSAFGPAGETFDVVTSFEVIEHLMFHPRSFLAAANRALAPGGLFVLSTPNGGSWSVVDRLLTGGGGLQTYRFGGDMCHRCEYSVWEVKSLLRSAGFQIERVITANVYPTDRRGWYANFVRAALTASDALTLHPLRLRHLVLFGGSTQFVLARKISDCTPEQIVRV